jgi:hypothetical protein
MPLATKNGTLILKGGKLAENCNCCGDGWYCYDNPCSQTPVGYNSLWTCSEDEIPPEILSVKVTFSGEKWCEWAFGGGSEKGPAYAFSRTYDASTSLNATFSLTRASIIVPIVFFQNYGYSCGYSDGAWPNALHSPPIAGVNSIIIAPGNQGSSEQPIGTPWECFLRTTIYVKQYDSTTQIPYLQWQSTQPACSASTSGTESLGLGTYTSPRGSTNYEVYRSDAGPFTATNPTLSGLKWTLSNTGHQICTVEVVQP